jgi:hypothetical protein
LIPDLSILASDLPLFTEFNRRLSSCGVNEPVTLFAPTDEAMKDAVQMSQPTPHACGRLQQATRRCMTDRTNSAAALCLDVILTLMTAMYVALRRRRSCWCLLRSSSGHALVLRYQADLDRLAPHEPGLLQKVWESQIGGGDSMNQTQSSPQVNQTVNQTQPQQPTAGNATGGQQENCIALERMANASLHVLKYFIGSATYHVSNTRHMTTGQRQQNETSEMHVSTCATLHSHMEDRFVDLCGSWCVMTLSVRVTPHVSFLDAPVFPRCSRVSSCLVGSRTLAFGLPPIYEFSSHLPLGFSS